MRSLSGITALLIGAVAGCGGGDGAVEPTPTPTPTGSVLTTLEVSPLAHPLFTVAPGNTVKLSVVAKDQNAKVITPAAAPTFSSDNGAIATVGSDGTISAVSAGTAGITASLTEGGVTKTGTTSVTAQVAPASAAVQAPGHIF